MRLAASAGRGISADAKMLLPGRSWPLLVMSERPWDWPCAAWPGIPAAQQQ